MTRPFVSVQELAFLTGAWRGGGLRIVFVRPEGTMLFGHLQTEQDEQTSYWETFRFAEEDGTLRLHATRRDHPVGRYALVALVRQPVSSATFEDPSNARHHRLTYAATAEGDLRLTVEGTDNRKRVREEWVLHPDPA